MRALLVEDERQLCDQLEAHLKKAGYAVRCAHDGQSALFLGKEYDFDVAIIDIGLPHISGLDVIRSWREKARDYPILILTALGSWQDKVEGLEAGADDYLVKPFHHEELLARLRALVRRYGRWTVSKLECGELTVDLAEQRVLIQDKEIALTAYEYRIIEYLALHRDEVISKTVLTEHIYDQDFDRDSNVIEVLVGRVRKKLGLKITQTQIETLRGRGYRLSCATPP